MNCNCIYDVQCQVILDLLLGYYLLCIFNINFKFCLDLLYCWYINEF